MAKVPTMPLPFIFFPFSLLCFGTALGHSAAEVGAEKGNQLSGLFLIKSHGLSLQLISHRNLPFLRHFDGHGLALLRPHGHSVCPIPQGPSETNFWRATLVPSEKPNYHSKYIFYAGPPSLQHSDILLRPPGLYLHIQRTRWRLGGATSGQFGRRGVNSPLALFNSLLLPTPKRTSPGAPSTPCSACWQCCWPSSSP